MTKEPLIRLVNVSKVYEGAGVQLPFTRGGRAYDILNSGLKMLGLDHHGHAAGKGRTSFPAVLGELFSPGVLGAPRKQHSGQLSSELYPRAPKVTAVKNVSLEIYPGEFTAIAGPSGSGKSTLLNLIGTLDSLTAGELYFEGRRLSRLSENELADFRLRSLGFVFQAYNLIPVLTAVENVEYVLTLQKLPKAERRSRATEALKWVGLESAAHRRPDQLSGGQQQRVAVARAIVHRPILVLADEPTANLDSKTSASLLDLMGELNEKHGITFLFSSHDEIILSRARRVLHIRDGSLHNDGN